MERWRVAELVSDRRGISRLEIVVIVACLAVIAAVAVPLIYSTRIVSQRQRCLARVTDLSRATLEAVTLRNGEFPPLENGRFGWPGLLLRHVNEGEAAMAVLAGDGPDQAGELRVPVFVCPADPDSSGQPGGLSYVANAGYGLFKSAGPAGPVEEVRVHTPAIDLDGDGEVSLDEYRINLATGVLWRETDIDTPVTIEFIEGGDGLTHTLMLTENLNAGTWTSRKTLDLAFVIGRESLEFAGEPAGANALDLKSSRLGAFAPHVGGPERTGRWPAPASLHEGFVHVGFCDGHTRPLAVNIDHRVYARLMTPAGTQYGQER